MFLLFFYEDLNMNMSNSMIPFSYTTFKNFSHFHITLLNHSLASTWPPSNSSHYHTTTIHLTPPDRQNGQHLRHPPRPKRHPTTHRNRIPPRHATKRRPLRRHPRRLPRNLHPPLHCRLWQKTIRPFGRHKLDERRRRPV